MSDMAVHGYNLNDETAQQQAEFGTAEPVLGPGAQLAARREQLNWTIEHVANQLNLAARQIQAIEDDNYAALPGMASVRGFIRAYAKLLKMDATPLLQIIAHEASPTSLQPLGPALATTPFSESRLSSMSKRLPSQLMTAVLVLVVLAGLVLVGQRMGLISSWPESLSLKIDQGLAPFSGSDGASRADASTAAVSTVVVPEIPGSVGDIVVKTEPVAAHPVDPVAPPAITPAPIVKAPVVSVGGPPVNTKDSLVLTVREKSWIEIRRPDQTILLSRLVKAGEVETLKVTGPLTLAVGNAAGVDATLRNKPIDLQSEAKGNVVRLNLK
jgi:cytoskeleton protein RodZ